MWDRKIVESGPGSQSQVVNRISAICYESNGICYSFAIIIILRVI